MKPKAWVLPKWSKAAGLTMLLLTTAACATSAPTGPGNLAGKNASSPTVPHSTKQPLTTTTQPTKVIPQLPLSGKTIAIDPGHNGDNYEHTPQINQLVNAGGFEKACDTTGTETDAGYTEATFNFNVAEDLTTMLRGEGATVVLTRASNTGWGPCINERAAIGNNAHANAAISIHADGGPATGRGFEVLYPPSTGVTAAIGPASLRLANDIRTAYLAGTGMPYATYVGNNGLNVRTSLGGLNLSTVPKVFIECGNMRNSVDAALLSAPAFQKQAARSIADGLVRFLDTYIGHIH